jgi:hypothetical protein
MVLSSVGKTRTEKKNRWGKKYAEEERRETEIEGDNLRYRYASHNEVSVNDGPHK